MKNLNLLKSALCVSLMASLVACGNGNSANNSGLTEIDAASITSNPQLTKQQKSEKLARASEQLLNVQGFAYADEVADLSLNLDPSNVRAKFIKAILSPIIAQKGIYNRVKPLADLDAKVSREYIENMAKFDVETPNSTVKEFLLDGQPDIRNEVDLQEYLDSVAGSFNGIREFAKKHKNSELTVMASDTLYKTMLGRYQSSCQVHKVSEGKYEANCPDVRDVMEIKMNRADFEALQHLAAGYELYFSLANSYNLSGSINKALSWQHNQQEEIQSIIDDLIANKDFATLRGKNGFQKVKAMGIDAIAGARWIMSNQNALCQAGRSHARNRIGMLFNYGLCMDRSNAVENSKDLSIVSEILAGKILDEVKLKGDYVTSLKPISLFEAPIADLRSAMPLSYDRCGNVTSLKDSTLAGVFIKGDANAYLSATTTCDQ